MEKLNLTYNIFVIDETPYCLWGEKTKEMTLEFLNNFDPKYYDYLANLYSAELQKSSDHENKNDKHFPAYAIRTSFSQGLENLFAFLYAAIQAPHCFPAWINLYWPKDISNITNKINNQEKISSWLLNQNIDWFTLSEVIHKRLEIENNEKQAQIKKAFGDLWSIFASLYLQQSFLNEYNSIKHGFRVAPGGSEFAFSQQEKELLSGKSEYGSSFFRAEKIENAKGHYAFSQISRNWDPEDMVWGLRLISLSLSNIVSAVKAINGVGQVQFQWPSNLDTFRESWKRTVDLGVTSINLNMNIDERYIEKYSKEEMLEKYVNKEIVGIREIQFETSNHV